MGDLAPKVDIPVVLAKLATFSTIAAAFAAHPVIGAAVASAVSCFIPERRAQRLELFAERLNERVSAITPELPPTTLDDDYNLSFLEDSLMAAARATSSERIDFIASILANGLTSKDAKRLDRKYLLSLLNEMNDIEVLLLCSKAYNTMGSGKEFWEKRPRSWTTRCIAPNSRATCGGGRSRRSSSRCFGFTRRGSRSSGTRSGRLAISQI
jgi:hypothetical protein